MMTRALATDADEMEDANNLIYLRARYYDPELGIFLSEDPVEGNINDPMSLNGYAYAQGNPVNNTDPSGTRICSDVTQENNPQELHVCLRNVGRLRRNFGIRFRDDTSDNLSNWTSQRVNNVYNAVQAISEKLGGLTRQAIGDTVIQLVGESEGTEAARATRCDLLTLFLNFPEASNHVHTVNNLIHEFGHLITLSSPTGRIANSEALGPATEILNRPVELWRQVQNNRGFSETLGWDASSRENHTDLPAEVVADMFLYWVQFNSPFPQDAQFIGQARSAFINGGDIPNGSGSPLTRINENTPINDGSVIQSAGIMAWAANATCAAPAGASIPDTALADYPEVIAANNGWCNFA